MVNCFSVSTVLVHFTNLSIGKLLSINYNILSFRGMSDKKKVKPFRQSFGRLGELKSFLPENTPWLVLTATATKETIRLIQKSLNLTNVTFVKSSPNRENIVYSVSKITADIKTTFGWLLQEIENNGVQVDRTIIYCNQIKQCADIFDHLKQSLGAKMFFQSRQEVPNRLVAMYHHSTKQHIKDAVLSSLLDSSGTIRVVIATSALGMGVNMQNVRRVIHYGPPKDIEAYMQESGRGGRDGGLAYATLSTPTCANISSHENVLYYKDYMST